MRFSSSVVQIFLCVSHKNHASRDTNQEKTRTFLGNESIAHMKASGAWLVLALAMGAIALAGSETRSSNSSIGDCESKAIATDESRFPIKVAGFTAFAFSLFAPTSDDGPASTLRAEAEVLANAAWRTSSLICKESFSWFVALLKSTQTVDCVSGCLSSSLPSLENKSLAT
jgi:hypothetical protein